ncbi:MAG TPA: cell division protein ZapA [Candidatus Acidoferrum sp.]|jgi:cell division protein ZapA|nr:cell division protein ZapA [Candidatus Acidoferrum sp.]
MDDKQTVRVTILSRPYSLRVSGDPREVEAVAASVNELMLSIAGRSPDSDSTRIAVLACLHLADKLHALEKENQQLKQQVGTRSEAFEGLVERLVSAVEEAAP